MKTTIRDITRSAALSCLLAAAATAYGGEIRYTLRLDPTAIETDTITAPDGTPYLRLWAPDCDYVGEPGEPMIPYKCINFLVPTYSNNFTVTVDNVTTSESRTLGLPLYPVQEPQSVNDFDPTLFTEPRKHNTDSDVKGIVTREFIENGFFHIVSVSLPIISLNITTDTAKSVSVLEEIEVILRYDLCGQSDTQYEVFQNANAILTTDVVNPPAQSSVKSAGVLLKNASSKYFIVTPENLKSSLAGFASWKMQKGNNVIIKTVEELLSDSRFAIGSNDAIFDVESSVREWLKSQCNLNDPSDIKLLIVGDQKSGAPVRKFRRGGTSADSYNNVYDGENFLPTDAYFSDLTTTFKITHKTDEGHYYGLNSDNMMYSPWLLTGRLLVNKNEQINNYLDKLLIYELFPGLGDFSYLDEGLVCKQNEFLLHRSNKTIFDGIGSFDNVTLLADTEGLLDFENSRPTGKEVIDAMSNCGLISLHGHGSPATITCSGTRTGWLGKYDAWAYNRYIQSLGKYTEKDTGHPFADVGNGFDNLNNWPRPSILYSITCTAIPFEDIFHKNEGYRNLEYNLGAAFTTAGKFGGVAMISNTRTGYTPSGYTLEEEFGQSLTFNNSIGYALVESSKTVSNSVSIYDLFARNLIGDPDISVWLGIPGIPCVNVSTDFQTIDFMGSDCMNAKVVVYDGNQTNYSFIPPQNLNKLTLQLSSIGMANASDFVVNVFKKGRLPYVKLFSNGSVINGIAKRYFLKDCILDSNKNSHVPSFTIINNGSLNLTCLSSFISDNGFDIKDGGEATIKSYQDVHMGNDTIGYGGKMELVSTEVILDSGFVVEKGGCLVINNCK